MDIEQRVRANIELLGRELFAHLPLFAQVADWKEGPPLDKTQSYLLVDQFYNIARFHVVGDITYASGCYDECDGWPSDESIKLHACISIADWTIPGIQPAPPPRPWRVKTPPAGWPQQSEAFAPPWRPKLPPLDTTYDG